MVLKQHGDFLCMTKADRACVHPDLQERHRNKGTAGPTTGQGVIQQTPSTLELVTSVSGAESLLSRAVRKKCSASDCRTFIKLFMSMRESCLVAAASPFTSVVFGSALELCSFLAHSEYINIEGLSLCVRSFMSLKGTDISIQ